MGSCLLDSNIYVYLFDDTSEHHPKVLDALERLIKKDTQFVITHHVLEEFIFVQTKLIRRANLKSDYAKLQNELDKISSFAVNFIEPSEDFQFVKRVVEVMRIFSIEANDAYILTLILEHDVELIFTFDQKLQKVARKLKIKLVE